MRRVSRFWRRKERLSEIAHSMQDLVTEIWISKVSGIVVKRSIS